MLVIEHIREMQDFRLFLSSSRKRIAFVPTMGFLHDGHLSLIREARRLAERVVVSIFVNPLQFGPREDLERYPRDLAGDKDKCRLAGADLVFIPQAGEIAGELLRSYVIMDEVMDRYCGASRPGHFRGVATIVLKLVNLVRPDYLLLGAKDYQQSVILRKLVSDFFIPLQVVVMPTIREKDGLAMSSRNSYLNPDERAAASVLFRSLLKGGEAYLKGERQVSLLKAAILSELEKEKGVRLEYLELVAGDTLRPVDTAAPGTMALLAVWIGRTRLIDNHSFSGGPETK